jgi:hypothetical protein
VCSIPLTTGFGDNILLQTACPNTETLLEGLNFRQVRKYQMQMYAIPFTYKPGPDSPHCNLSLSGIHSRTNRE